MRLAFNRPRVSYAAAMEEPHILLTLDTREPVELGEFVSLFVAIGNQYERFVASAHPDMKAASRFYVKEIRAGSIIAELIAKAAPAAAVGWPIMGQTMDALDRLNTLHDFVDNYGKRISAYFKAGGRAPEATKSDLSDFYKTVAAVSHDPEGTVNLEAAFYEDGKREVRTGFKFSTPQARLAETEISEHRREIESTTEADHKRVLMTFVRSDKTPSRSGKRSGELVLIESITAKPLPVVYASDLAEQRIKHEIADEQDNVYHKAFDVDVNVEMRGGKPLAYRIVAIHAVIPIEPDS